MSHLVLFLYALVATQTVVEPAPVQRAVMVPIRLPPGAGNDLVSAAPGIERALVEALGRHATFRLMTHNEIAALAGNAAREQLLGCDAEGCAAEIAGALGAELIITAELNRTGGGWNLRASVLDRVHAAAIRRAGVQARSLDALMASLDVIARELAGGSTAALTDPRLAERLGVSRGAAQQFVAQARSDQDVTTSWTNWVIAHNAEKEWVAVLEGGLLAAAGVSLLVAGALLVPLSGAVEHYEAASQPAMRTSPGTYQFPVAVELVYTAALGFLGLGVLTLLTAFSVVAVVDALDLGRISVRTTGCCRDERRIAAAEKPGPGRRLAPYLAAAGALALGLPVTSTVAAFVSGYIISYIPVSRRPKAPEFPSLGVTAPVFTALTIGRGVAQNLAMTGLLLSMLVVSLAAAAVLIVNEGGSLTAE